VGGRAAWEGEGAAHVSTAGRGSRGGTQTNAEERRSAHATGSGRVANTGVVGPTFKLLMAWSPMGRIGLAAMEETATGHALSELMAEVCGDGVACSVIEDAAPLAAVTPAVVRTLRPKPVGMDACFVGDTEVWGALGLVSIEALDVGDWVWAREMERGELALSPVVQVFESINDTVRLVVESQRGTFEVVTTEAHPFWRASNSPDDSGFTPVAELRTGDVVRTNDGWAVVRSVEPTGRVETVYNIEVAERHTYFVGGAGLWVHNKPMRNPDFPESSFEPSAAGAGQEEAAAVVASTAGASRGGTYKLVDPETGQVMRTGRSKNLDTRKGQHRRDPAHKDLDFEVDRRTDDYAQQRGREQVIHDTYDPPLDKIEPISPTNPHRGEYLDAAKDVE
jgi:Pretoxin HINT domain